jgi:cytidine deaminase
VREKLEKFIDNAYAPYSNFKVGCIVKTKDNKEFIGVNVENANGTSICAERHAIGNAISHGYKKGDIKEIYIGFKNGNFGTPCFSCRQVILELCDKDTKIISVNKNNEYKEYTVEDLCPYPFGEDDLK